MVEWLQLPLLVEPVRDPIWGELAYLMYRPRTPEDSETHRAPEAEAIRGAGYVLSCEKQTGQA